MSTILPLSALRSAVPSVFSRLRVSGPSSTSLLQFSTFRQRRRCPVAAAATPMIAAPRAALFGPSSSVAARAKSDSSDQKASSEPASKEGGEVSPQPVVVVEKMSNMHIMSIGINRPHKRNCVNEQTASELYAAFQDFENDKNMSCAVLHGLGGNFCAGYDLDSLTKIGDDLPNKLAAMLDRGPMGPTRMELKKPVIAAVSGWAVAGGLELALMCDLRVVEESARMGVLCRRFGVPLIDGGTVRLPELIGLSRALDIILTGRIVEAKEAYDIGLANRIVATGTAYGQAINLAREIVKFPQECLKVDRASAYHATYTSKSLEDSLQFEIENALHVINRESIKGAQKFVEGLGKHGKFNVNPSAEKQEWEKEFEQMESAEAKEKKDK